MYKSLFMGCYCTRVTAYALTRQQNNPLPPGGDHSGMGARPNAAASPTRGSIFLASPDMGGVWVGAYIYRSICGTLPLERPPLGTSDWWWMVVHFALSFEKASSWISATLPPAKWWKWEGLGLNCWRKHRSKWQVTLVGDKEIDKFDGKANCRRW